MSAKLYRCSKCNANHIYGSETFRKHERFITGPVATPMGTPGEFPPPSLVPTSQALADTSPRASAAKSYDVAVSERRAALLAEYDPQPNEDLTYFTTPPPGLSQALCDRMNITNSARVDDFLRTTSEYAYRAIEGDDSAPLPDPDSAYGKQLRHLASHPEFGETVAKFYEDSDPEDVQASFISLRNWILNDVEGVETRAGKKWITVNQDQAKILNTEVEEIRALEERVAALSARVAEMKTNLYRRIPVLEGAGVAKLEGATVMVSNRSRRFQEQEFLASLPEKTVRRYTRVVPEETRVIPEHTVVDVEALRKKYSDQASRFISSGKPKVTIN